LSTRCGQLDERASENKWRMETGRFQSARSSETIDDIFLSCGIAQRVNLFRKTTRLARRRKARGERLPNNPFSRALAKLIGAALRYRESNSSKSSFGRTMRSKPRPNRRLSVRRALLSRTGAIFWAMSVPDGQLIEHCRRHGCGSTPTLQAGVKASRSRQHLQKY